MCYFFNDTATTEIYTYLSLHDALPISQCNQWLSGPQTSEWVVNGPVTAADGATDPNLRIYFAVRAYADGSHRSEEHTSELQSLMRTSYAVFCLNKKTAICVTEITTAQRRHSTKSHHSCALTLPT